MPICLQGDALYATGPMMRICRENGWKYIFTQLDTRQKTVGESYTWILEGGGGTIEKNIGKELGTGKYVNHVEEVTGKEEMIGAGRGRWKIENEGFNNQKHGIYRIEHLNSRDSNAMKNHYLLTQIADLLMQVYLNWNPLLEEIGQSIKIHPQGYWKVFADTP